MKRPALFLDRDGVLIEDVGYLNDPARITILPGVFEAMNKARAAGYALIVVSNQSGIARGYLSEERMLEVSQVVYERLAVNGAGWDGFYYCPHHAAHGDSSFRVACTCRKPEPGMLLRAAEERNLDIERSWMIGDKDTDILAGQRAGCRTGLVGKELLYGADIYAPTLLELVEQILA